jgi:hypothetical protein
VIAYVVCRAIRWEIFCSDDEITYAKEFQTPDHAFSGREPERPGRRRKGKVPEITK